MRGGVNPENLYVALTCSLQGTPLSKANRHDDHAIFQDDRLEMYFSLTDQPGDVFFQIVVNAGSTMSDITIRRNAKGQSEFDGAWESRAKCHSQHFQGTWTLEMSIPLESLGVDLSQTPGFHLLIQRAGKARKEIARSSWRWINLPRSSNQDFDPPVAATTADIERKMDELLEADTHRRTLGIIGILETMKRMLDDQRSMKDIQRFLTKQRDPFESALGGEAILQTYAARQETYITEHDPDGFAGLIEVGYFFATHMRLLHEARDGEDFLRLLENHHAGRHALADSLASALRKIPDWSPEQKNWIWMYAGSFLLFDRKTLEDLERMNKRFPEWKGETLKTYMNGIASMAKGGRENP